MKNEDIVEVCPNIYRIAGRSRAAHAYLVRGLRKNVLIDAGLPASGAHLERSLAAIGLCVRDVHMVVLTHEHVDHAGAAPLFAEAAVIAAHRLAAAKLALKDEFALMNRAFDAAPGEVHVDLLLEEGAVIALGNFELQVLHTPGHCSGALCLYEPGHRLLFSGDTVMAEGVIGGVLGSGNISDYIHSLRKLAALRITHLYPGHGRASPEAEADIRRGIERLQELLDDSKALFDALEHSPHNFEPIMRSLRELNIEQGCP